MQFAGAGLGIAQGVSRGIGAAGGAMTSARDLEQQADLTRFQTRFEARQEKKRTDRIIAKNVANVAAGNVDVSSGTPLETELENVGEAELQRLDIVHRGKTEENRLRQGARRARVEALASLTDAFTLGIGGGMVRGASGFFGG